MPSLQPGHITLLNEQCSYYSKEVLHYSSKQTPFHNSTNIFDQEYLITFLFFLVCQAKRITLLKMPTFQSSCPPPSWHSGISVHSVGSVPLPRTRWRRRIC